MSTKTIYKIRRTKDGKDGVATYDTESEAWSQGIDERNKDWHVVEYELKELRQILKRPKEGKTK